MKKIGLVGGIGPASTVDYYIGITKMLLKETGAYPKIVIDSVNMLEATEYIAAGNYKQSAELMLKSVSALKAAGAEFAAITANTEHIVWNEMKDRFEIPVISIVDSVVNKLLRTEFKRVLILGTVFTLKSGIYEDSLIIKGITPIIPNNDDKEIIGNLIYPNLENGIIIPEDKEKMLAIAGKYISENQADAILLACTELPLMIKESDLSVPVLNSTKIHISAIAEYAKN